ncbi:Lactonase, 7-bladed beta-propeller-domain-containing protein [Coniella lustricola]|uniref:Lactonase, 7-bladed beta-propeller-domain-containing protein n=1 Tax=Coniella lustricola TaxID=2025994 RepID=A0A2T2ZVJ3_9PEZI|nr:Lactonase, 7-bladed beta-propeller-domain-containing protein [Coniella lustricola]
MAGSALGGGDATIEDGIGKKKEQDQKQNHKVLIGGGQTGTVTVAEFDGTAFEIVAQHVIAGSAPNWMVAKASGRALLFVNDENGDAVRVFCFDAETNELQLIETAKGSSGVVHLGFNKDQSVMVGAAFGEGTIDVWDLQEEKHDNNNNNNNNSINTILHLRKKIPVGGVPGPVAGRQDSPHPHQALLDPTGAFFVVADLATDSLLVVDAEEYTIRNRVEVVPSGAGPRHGAFLTLGGKTVTTTTTTTTKATHFAVVCEISNVIKVYKLDYDHDRGIGFDEVQAISTFGQDSPPSNPGTAAAGELIVDARNENLYVSNRLTGDGTDNIAHFCINHHNDNDNSAKPVLTFVDQVSSGGLLPRMFSLSKEDNVLFSTNQDGECGMVAFGKDGKTGRLTRQPLASVSREVFGGPNLGPQFVMQI